MPTLRPMTPRYLAPFHPKRVSHYFTDVLIIGGGLAGMRAADAVDPTQSVLMVTKEALEQSNSNYAQGGIAGVLDPEDRFEDHIEDTLRAGGALCDREVVEMVIRQAPERIDELIRWGAHFDEEAGAIALAREGGHSHRRIVHALDSTGREIMRAVIEHTRRLENVTLWPNTFTVDLLTHEGTCRGAMVWNDQYRQTLIWAKQTILCTGGAGRLYRETTNPAVATGDGIAMAYRAGAEVRDMEFMQFHPTVLYIAGSDRHLITEAIRGEGAHLVDRDGHRFMPDYDERAELAPRDVVSRAIVEQMRKTHSPNVYLDVRHLDAEMVRARFPGIAAICKSFQLDLASDRIPVRPGAHYMIGGLTVDAEGRTTLSGLWAAGEVTSTGLHGANRLASNSLLEGLVYGMHSGSGASQAAEEIDDDYSALSLVNPLVKSGEEPLDLADIRNSLTSLMWRYAGVCRDAAGLGEAAGVIDQWCRYCQRRQFHDPAGWELQNMLTIGRLMIAAAVAREESRGVHQRVDFPETDDEKWLRHLSYRRSDERDA
ncbi:MAG: L-aspartate oxidase [Planctomycetes bacterium]|nr:L-aspartate oxidase [Planctomycetota bacterium]